MAPTSPSDAAVATTAARAGAAVVRSAIGGSWATEMKGLVDPVSEIDRAAEAAIIDVIQALRPDDGILAEEGGGDGRRSGRRWIIDPLDGTVNFLHGIPHVGVSVALWDDDQPLAATVIDVHRDEEFAAEAGQGATCNGEPIHVSDRAELIDCVFATGFPYDRDRYGAEYSHTIGAVISKVRGVRRIGSAVLDCAWVACGRLDGYWEFNLAPWDAAAGALLVAEAGGRTAGYASEPLDLQCSTFIFSNAGVADAFTDLIRKEAPAHVRPTN